MIYSNEFVWLHFPKCAGRKIETLFSTYYSQDGSIHQDIVKPRINPVAIWHDTIAKREKSDPSFILGNRTVICSFRRLPAWLESRYSYEVRRSPQLEHRPELLLEGKFLERRGRENHADFYARKYIPESILGSDKLKFIRTEYFESDFKSVFGEFIDLTRIPDWEFGKRVNASDNSALPDEIRDKLFQDSDEVYEKCPYWKAVENVAYG